MAATDMSLAVPAVLAVLLLLAGACAAQGGPCTNSTACPPQTLANCCQGECSIYYSHRCGPGKCAAQEVWITNPSPLQCRNKSNVCGSTAMGVFGDYFCYYDGTAQCVNAADGANATCVCKPGWAGRFCDTRACTSTNNCSTHTVVENCCAGQCVPRWAPACATHDCTGGDKWIPNASPRWCRDPSNVCGEKNSFQWFCSVYGAAACTNKPDGSGAMCTCKDGWNGPLCENGPDVRLTSN